MLSENIGKKSLCKYGQKTLKNGPNNFMFNFLQYSMYTRRTFDVDFVYILVTLVLPVPCPSKSFMCPKHCTFSAIVIIFDGLLTFPWRKVVTSTNALNKSLTTILANEAKCTVIQIKNLISNRISLPIIPTKSPASYCGFKWFLSNLLLSKYFRKLKGVCKET